jgi:ATP synthase protein I
MDKRYPGAEPKRAAQDKRFGAVIGEKEKIKMRARLFRNTWFGFSVFGLVGWSVAIPTLLGIGLGIWLDSHYRSRYSWTLMLLIAGLAIGCLNAWHWVSRESQTIRREQDKTENHD